MHPLTFFIIAAAIGVPMSTATPDECSAVSSWVTGCNDGNEIIIDGTRPGPNAPNPNPNPIDNSVPNPNAPPVPPTPEEELAECLAEWDDYIGCFNRIDQGDPADEEGTIDIPPVTISDVARFAPDGPVLVGEPENVGVAGLPTNFVASASVHTVNGELFGFPVTVRFTPVAFDFAFGDGAATSTASGGQSWDDLGQAQFTPTPTSHTYPERGTYSANVNVRYTAEVDFGIGWFPISGEVTATGPSQEIRIFEAHTALVAHTCEQAPSSPGC